MPEKLLEIGSFQYSFAQKYFSDITFRKPFILDVLKSVKTPTLVIDLSRIKERYNELQNTLKEAKIYYAVKANDHQDQW
jgi:ornithine decarboxylase